MSKDEIQEPIFNEEEIEDICINCGFGEWRHNEKHSCRKFDNGLVKTPANTDKLDSILLKALPPSPYRAEDDLGGERWVDGHKLAREQLKSQILDYIEEAIEYATMTWGNGRATPGEHIDPKRLKKKLRLDK